MTAWFEAHQMLFATGSIAFYAGMLVEFFRERRS